MALDSTRGRLPPGLRAQSIGLPMERDGGRFTRYRGVERVRRAIEHLVRTPLGALKYIDPEYGTIFYLLRTQPMVLDTTTGESRGSNGLRESAVGHFRGQVGLYIPGAVIHGVSPRLVKPGDGKLQIHIVWTLASAGGQGMQGGLPGGGLGDTTIVTL